MEIASIFSHPAFFAASTAAFPPSSAAVLLEVPTKDSTSGASILVSTAMMGFFCPKINVFTRSAWRGAIT